MFYAFDYYKTTGACHEENYKYKGEDGKCKAKKCSSDSNPISDYHLIKKNDPTLIHEELKNGPCSIGVEADTGYFQFFTAAVS
jgi:hypothetical protein